MILIRCDGVCSAPKISSLYLSGQNPTCFKSIFFPFSSKSPKPVSLSFLCGSRFHCKNSLLGHCKASIGDDNRSVGRGRGRGSGRDDLEEDDQFLQAFVLVSDFANLQRMLRLMLKGEESFRHYNFWKHGFVEETKQHSPGLNHQFALQGKGKSSGFSSIGHGLLRQFQSPTIFLRIACDGDLLLPVIVGELAITELMDAYNDDKHGECPDQYQLVKNIVGTCGYEVKMVRITGRVVNSYYASIFIGETAKRANIILDARPSDAINLAERFKAPIYVSKELVLKDAIKLVYGRWRGSRVKTIYDVTLDSAVEGPDPFSEELDLLEKMNIAVQEERFSDAAILRDILTKIREPRHEL